METFKENRGFRSDGSILTSISTGNRYYENNYYFMGRNRWVEYADKVSPLIFAIWDHFNCIMLSASICSFIYRFSVIPYPMSCLRLCFCRSRWTMTVHRSRQNGTDGCITWPINLRLWRNLLATSGWAVIVRTWLALDKPICPMIRSPKKSIRGSLVISRHRNGVF